MEQYLGYEHMERRNDNAQRYSRSGFVKSMTTQLGEVKIKAPIDSNKEFYLRFTLKY